MISQRKQALTVIHHHAVAQIQALDHQFRMRLNLRDGVVMYDSQRLFALRDHLGVPDFDVDYDRAINLRQSLGLPVSSRFHPEPGERSEERRVGKECRSRWS